MTLLAPKTSPDQTRQAPIPKVEPSGLATLPVNTAHEGNEPHELFGGVDNA